MKIIFFSDTHLGFDHPVRPRHPRRRRGPDFLRNFHRVLQHAVESGASLVLHGGDLFDHGEVPPAVVDEAYFALAGLANAGIPVGIIAGNHERSALPSSLLLRHPLIHVFHRAGAHTFHAGGMTVNVVGVPFVRGDVADLARRVHDDVRPARADVNLMLLHQPFEGATVGAQEYTFRDRPDTLRMDALPTGYDAFLSGHIHRRQVLWNHGVPVIYPGSIERTSWAERFEDKGFIEINVDGTQRLIRNLPLPVRPQLAVNLRGTVRARVTAELAEGIARFPPDAVVRVDGEPAALAHVNVHMLDEVVPMGMSVSWRHAAM